MRSRSVRAVLRRRVRRAVLAADPLWRMLHAVLGLQRAADTRTVALEELPANLTHMVVLGAGARGGIVSLVLRERLDRALELAHARPDLTIVVSGDGRAESGQEDLRMEGYLVERGIGAARIRRDPRGYSTRATFRAARLAGIRRVAVVTNDFHRARAVHVALMSGLDAWTVSDARARQYSGAPWPLAYDERRDRVAHLRDWWTLRRMRFSGR